MAVFGFDSVSSFHVFSNDNRTCTLEQGIRTRPMSLCLPCSVHMLACFIVIPAYMGGHRSPHKSYKVGSAVGFRLMAALTTRS